MYVQRYVPFLRRGGVFFLCVFYSPIASKRETRNDAIQIHPLFHTSKFVSPAPGFGCRFVGPRIPCKTLYVQVNFRVLYLSIAYENAIRSLVYYDGWAWLCWAMLCRAMLCYALRSAGLSQKII